MTEFSVASFNFLGKLAIKAFVRWGFCLLPLMAWSEEWANLRRLEKEGAVFTSYVFDLQQRKVISEYNAYQRLSPASVTKLVLGAAALERWGSEFVFVTRTFRSGALQSDGTLEGSLVVEAAGDAFLSNEKLGQWAYDIARAGIRRVKGDLILDTRRFGPIELDQNRLAGKERSAFAYDSPLSAAGLNFSVANLVVMPGSKVGEAAKVAFEPFLLSEEGSYVLVNGVQTTENTTQLAARRERHGNKDVFTVSGKIALHAGVQRLYRSVSDADFYAASVYRAFLAQAGVRLEGKGRVQPQFKSENMQLITSVESFPLDYQIRGLMKFSNNYIADMLTLGLSAEERGGSGGTLSHGAGYLEGYMQKILQETTLPKAQGALSESQNLVIRSGSGLTPENRLSAYDVVALLERMYNNAREFPTFLASLPIPGAEGTVRKRFDAPRERHLRDILRAKTGTLTEPRDVVGFAGYLRHAQGSWIAFCVLVNGSAKTPHLGIERIRDAIDADLADMFPARTNP